MKKLIVFFLSFFITFSLFAEARNALLIANENYDYLSNITTPVKEAKDLKVTLEKLGFSVTLVENGSREKMLDSLDEFQAKLKTDGGIGFFHYGGHGVQVDGKDYFIPIDAYIQEERDVLIRAVDVDEVMASMKADTNIVIVDAGRDNVFRSMRGPSSGISKRAGGLAFTSEMPKSFIIVFSTQPGDVTYDGVFTLALTVKLLEQKELGALLREVRKEVFDKTNGIQIPFIYNCLTEAIYLAGKSETHQ